MPLTLAHPAIAYPFRGALVRRGVVTAFAIGSMTPDVPYFVRLWVTGGQSHSLAGLLWFCVPAGLALWGLYGLLLKPFLLELVPTGVRARLEDERPSPVGARGVLALVAFPVLVGACSHVLWDSFTHGSGIAVRMMPVLQKTTMVAGLALPRFSLLQYLSTLAGLAMLGLWSAQWFRDADVRPLPGPPPWSFRLRMLVVLLLVAPGAASMLIKLWPILHSRPATFRTVQNTVSAAAFSGGSASLAMLFLAALVWRVVSARRHRVADRRA